MPPIVDRRQFLSSAALLGGALAWPCIAPAKPSRRLHFGLSGYPPSFHPWAQSGTAAGTIKLLLHRGLLSYGQDGSLRGELARSWDVDEGGTWTFRLQKASFHDGQTVTSADVRWTIEQVADARSTAYFRGQMQSVVDIDTPDDATVRITTRKPIATLPNWFAHFNMPIIQRGADADSTVGAGPFKMGRRERDVSVRLDRYDDYYKPGLPRVAGIDAIVYADEHLRVAALEAGDVDIIEFVPWQSMQRLSGDSRIALDAVDGPFMYLTFNGSRPPFDDPRVRKAVAHAVKREDVVNGAFYGFGSALAHLPIARSSDYFNPEHEQGWAYDPVLARRLLSEAGYPNGFSCNLLATAQYGMHQNTAEIVQAYLSMIGIDARLRLTDWPTRVQLGNAGRYDIAVMGTTTDSNDPDGLSDILDSSLPPSFTRSIGIQVPAIDRALSEGRRVFERSERRRIYRDMEAAAIEAAPVVGLNWRSQAYAMHGAVQGFANLPGQLTSFSGVTLENVSLG